MQPVADLQTRPGRVFIAAAVTVLSAAVEVVVARRAGSFFLLADAVHLLAHLAIFGVLLSQRHGSAVRDDVSSCAVLTIVLAIAGVIGIDSLRALRVSEVEPRPAAFLFSLFGLAANLITAGLFREPSLTRWSFRAALVHELSDASLTLVGLLGAVAIAFFHLSWVDPGLSLVIATWLSIWAGRLLLRRVLHGPGVWRSIPIERPLHSS
ncbi:MAG TPA: cation transporter [Polyangia bacterium]|nr:cation transporter [Polyangia bacterium]